jgi:membrane fusion protein
VTAYDPTPLFRPEVAEARKQRLEGEILLSQPVRAHVLTAVLVAIIAIVAAWIAFGTYTRSEVARGILVTDTPSAKVMPLRPGRIVQLLAHDGDRVRAGQKLATVRVEQSDENGDSPGAGSLDAIAAQQALAEQRADLASRHGAAERAKLVATLEGIRRQRPELLGEVRIQEKLVASAREMFERMTPVLERGFVSRIEYERRRQALLTAEQHLAQLHQQATALQAQERQTLADLASLGADTRTQISAARTAQEQAAQQRAQVLGERAYLITAPIGGRVTALQAAAGRVVEPGRPLMTIVPSGSALHAEIYAPTRAIGFVESGEEVRLLYDAFPYQRFGSFAGRVNRVSRTVLDPRDIAAPLKIEEPVYRTRGRARPPVGGGVRAGAAPSAGDDDHRKSHPRTP